MRELNLHLTVSALNDDDEGNESGGDLDRIFANDDMATQEQDPNAGSANLRVELSDDDDEDSISRSIFNNDLNLTQSQPLLHNSSSRKLTKKQRDGFDESDNESDDMSFAGDTTAEAAELDSTAPVSQATKYRRTMVDSSDDEE